MYDTSLFEAQDDLDRIIERITYGGRGTSDDTISWKSRPTAEALRTLWSWLNLAQRKAVLHELGMS